MRLIFAGYANALGNVIVRVEQKGFSDFVIAKPLQIKNPEETPGFY